MGQINYNYSINGDLKKELAVNGIKYHHLAAETQESVLTVNRWFRKPMNAELEGKIRTAITSIKKKRQEGRIQKPNEEFRCRLKMYHISIYELARAIGYNHQTIRIWLSVPLTQEHLMVLEYGIEKVRNSRE